MPYVFVRETVQCRASALDALAAVHEALRSPGRFEGSIHAARFQVDYGGIPRLRSFVIGNAVAKASGCSVILRFYVSRDLAKLLLLAGFALVAAAALRLWPAALLSAAALAALAVKTILDMRQLSSFFHRLLAP